MSYSFQSGCGELALENSPWPIPPIKFCPGEFPWSILGVRNYLVGIDHVEITRGNLIRGILQGGILLERFQRHKIFNHLILTALLLTNGNAVFICSKFTAIGSKFVRSE